MKDTLGIRLRKLRGSKTQLEVSKAVSIDNTVLSRIESDEKKTIEPELLNKFAEYYNVSVDYLLGRTNDSSPSNERNQYIKIFSTRLRQLREQNHLSISYLSERIGRTESYIEKLEFSPSQLPGQDVLNSLSEVFGVTRDYLCGYTDDPQGYGSNVYDSDPRDLTEFILNDGPVMFDGDKIFDQEDKEEILRLMRISYALVKEQNKQLYAKRRKNHGSKENKDQDK